MSFQLTMELLKSIFSDVRFTDKDQVCNILLEEGIDDMETLKESKEDDLRSAGLKVGDIIRIRRVLAKQSEVSVPNSSLLISRSPELKPEMTEIPAKCKCSLKSSTPKHLQELNENGQASITSPQVTCSYSPQDLLSKCAPGTKCTKAQLYFRNLLRECARQSKIWDEAYPLPSIPDRKLNKFFELISTATPQLKGYKNKVKKRLGQALQNKRKYQNDVKVGKRKGRNGNHCDNSNKKSTEKIADAQLSTSSHGEEAFVIYVQDCRL